MTALIMGMIGAASGFVLDYLIARMAREPYERGEMDENEVWSGSSEAAQLAFSAKPKTLDMPALLTTRSAYRRMVVVAATTALFAMAGWRYEGNVAYLAIVALYVSVFIICTATDVLAYRVPNSVTYPAIVGALVVGAVASDANWKGVVAGGLIFGGMLFIPSVLTGGAMGMGDVKLAFFVGFAVGLELLVPAMIIMALSGGLAAVLLLVTRLRRKGDPIPYAPFIAGGALVVILMQGAAFHRL